MPKNYNALLRYTTIDKLLKGGVRGYTIDELIEECSAALKEAEGYKRKISERTIREDMRIMKSSLLGFEAPIVVKDGKYYYSDSKFTINLISLNDKKQEQIEKIYEFLSEIRKEFIHPKLEILDEMFLPLLPGSSNVEVSKSLANEQESSTIEETQRPLMGFVRTSDVSMSKPQHSDISITWGDLFEIITRKK